jgi:hypothetical protein
VNAAPKAKKASNKTAEQVVQERDLKRAANHYVSLNPYVLGTTRFTEETLRENQELRQNNNQVGCAYASTREMSKEVPKEAIVLVLEMNNDTNTIMGIGMVRNRSVIGKYNIYSGMHVFHDHVYLGRMRIDRNELSPTELVTLSLLEGLCFKGSTHCKRSVGITRLSNILVYKVALEHGRNLIQEVVNMFRVRMGANFPEVNQHGIPISGPHYEEEEEEEDEENNQVVEAAAALMHEPLLGEEPVFAVAAAAANNDDNDDVLSLLDNGPPPQPIIAYSLMDGLEHAEMQAQEADLDDMAMAMVEQMHAHEEEEDENLELLEFPDDMEEFEPVIFQEPVEYPEIPEEDAALWDAVI